MGKKYLVSLISKQYEKDKLLGFRVAVFTYAEGNYSVTKTVKIVDKQSFYKMIEQHQIVPINFTVGKNRLNIMQFTKPGALIEQVAKAVRRFMVESYGTGTDLAGYCIEASEYIVAILKSYSIKDVKSVEGWCLWDDECYGSDRPYDAHTWVELFGGMIYLDVTADQFNPGMFKENEFKGIMISRGLPHGICREEPVEGVDY